MNLCFKKVTPNLISTTSPKCQNIAVASLVSHMLNLRKHCSEADLEEMKLKGLEIVRATTHFDEEIFWELRDKQPLRESGYYEARPFHAKKEYCKTWNRILKQYATKRGMSNV